jgi:hypothetical protein
MLLYIVLFREPLLGKDREANNEKTSAARQQILNKHQVNYNSEERCFLRCPCRDVISRTIGARVQRSRVEAGSNTSTVALRVVGGDEVSNMREHEPEK